MLLGSLTHIELEEPSQHLAKKYKQKGNFKRLQ